MQQGRGEEGGGGGKAELPDWVTYRDANWLGCVSDGALIYQLFRAGFLKLTDRATSLKPWLPES